MLRNFTYFLVGEINIIIIIIINIGIIIDNLYSLVKHLKIN